MSPTQNRLQTRTETSSPEKSRARTQTGGGVKTHRDETGVELTAYRSLSSKAASWPWKKTRGRDENRLRKASTRIAPLNLTEEENEEEPAPGHRRTDGDGGLLQTRRPRVAGRDAAPACSNRRTGDGGGPSLGNVAGLLSLFWALKNHARPGAPGCQAPAQRCLAAISVYAYRREGLSHNT